MSANNFLLINRETFKVTMNDADSGETITEIGEGKDLEEAIDIASDRLMEGNIEYGIEFTNFKRRV